jgi:hypothetical protein
MKCGCYSGVPTPCEKAKKSGRMCEKVTLKIEKGEIVDMRCINCILRDKTPSASKTKSTEGEKESQPMD